MVVFGFLYMQTPILIDRCCVRYIMRCSNPWWLVTQSFWVVLLTFGIEVEDFWVGLEYILFFLI